MKGYEGWSFRDKSFALGILVSLLWHFFWFFSITVTVNPNKRLSKRAPRVVALSPVLDDTIFRMLVETRPQLSETFYRRMSDFAGPSELAVKTMERPSAGEVVSLPSGKTLGESPRYLLGGSRPVFDGELDPAANDEGPARIEGEVEGRDVIYRPEEPRLEKSRPSSLKTPEIEVDFSVSPAGTVTEAAAVLSSGDAETDFLWVRYLKEWKFSPLKTGEKASVQRGRVKFRLEGK